MKKSKKIKLQDEKVCFYTGTPYGIDKHHIFGGHAFRKKSEEWGMYVYLRHDLHMKLHQHDYSMELELKQFAQRKFEEEYGHDEFMRIFKKNYL